MANTNTKIYAVLAREILDSRGDPTIETMVVLESGYRGIASVPAGTSIGKYEAVELRDKDAKRYGGMGVLKAIANVNGPIAAKLKGLDATNQGAIDKALLDLDATPDKHNLGANSILSVSLATAVASANAARVPLYRYVNDMFQPFIKTEIQRIPTPTFNIINGGKHGAGNLDFQEFHVVPATNKPFSIALEMGVTLYQAVRQILKYRNAIYSVGYEGGFAPNLFTNAEALDIIAEAVKSSPYTSGVEVFIGLDLAANTFKTDHGYRIKDKSAEMNGPEFIRYLQDLHKKYPLLILEDAFGEDDWENWGLLSKEVGNEVLVVGDDLLATNPERLKRAIREKSCSAILAKPNQIGSLSEFLAVIAIAKQHGMKTIVSNRSGETNDTFLADLAVGVQSDYVKFGAPARGERVAKYNRLLQIESEISHA
ncbi:MAG TPA: phosphopyruvate hydratase [Patescibacteria group bacterium]|nr:phosphopyruvate hydratase [Patescibacteria group bacterium]